MKYLKIIALIFVTILIISCLGKDKVEDVYGNLFGTFFNDDGYYVVADTVMGANGFEAKFFFKNDDTLKNVENKSRIYLLYRLIKEIKGVGYDVECLDYKLVQEHKILYIEEDNQAARDTLGRDSHSLQNLSISHDYLNIITQIQWKDERHHQLWITKDALEQNSEKNDEITLRLNHIDKEKTDYYNSSLFYISVPIKELQDLKPEIDTIYIRVIRIADNISDQTMTIPYIKR